MSLPGPGAASHRRPRPQINVQTPGTQINVEAPGALACLSIRAYAAGRATLDSPPYFNAGPATMYLRHSKLGRGCAACWRTRAQRAHPGCPESAPASGRL